MNAVRRIGGKARDFFVRLHEDESGPNTVEWILLVIVALVVLVGIYVIVKWVGGETNEQAKEMQQQRSSAKDTMKSISP